MVREDFKLGFVEEKLRGLGGRWLRGNLFPRAIEKASAMWRDAQIQKIPFFSCRATWREPFRGVWGE